MERTEGDRWMREFGWPDLANPQWFVVVPLTKDASKEPQSKGVAEPTSNADVGAARRWSEISRVARAGMLPSDDRFVAFAHDLAVWHGWPVGISSEEVIRKVCGVSSRSEIDDNPTASNLFDTLDRGFQIWKHRLITPAAAIEAAFLEMIGEENGS